MNEAIKFETRGPSTPVGLILVAGSVSAAGVLKLPGSKVKVEVNPGSGKVTVKGDLGEVLGQKLVSSMSINVNEVVGRHWDSLVGAVSACDPKKFAQILGSSASMDLKLEGGQVLGIKWEIGFDLTDIHKTPVAMKGTTDLVELPLGSLVSGYEGAILEATLGFGIHLGLSPKGWELVAKQVSKKLFQSFLIEAGAAFQTTTLALVANGTMALAGGILGVLVFTGGALYSIVTAPERGRIRGLVTWCGSGYVNRVWGESRPSGSENVLGEDPKFIEALIAHGEWLALTHAKQMVTAPEGMTYSDDVYLRSYRDSLERYYGDTWKARREIRELVQSKMREVLGG